MNERIRELAERAGMALKPRRLYDDNEPDGYLESDLDYLDNNLEATRVFFEGGLEKFAELIVLKCIEQGKQIQSQSVSNGSEEYNTGREMGIEVFLNQIKKHFGVE